MLKNKVVYIHSEELISHCNKLPQLPNRASIVQDLINSYELLTHDNLVVVQCEKATEEQLKSFHSTDYIDFLKSLNCDDVELFEIVEKHEEYGLGYDCPLVENIYDFVQTVAGSSVAAARLLAAKKCEIVINWFGGWHHAQRASAEGFCYVNDIVIAIQILSKAFDRILYLDLDIHHGNGVENAFQCSKKILTLSFHKCSPGFYPGTGSLNEVGLGKGKYYSINVPLKEGVSDETYLAAFNAIFPIVLDSFKPSLIVVQCGADGLNGDPIGQCNLTIKSLGRCVDTVLKSQLPALFLGGGGYNFANTARLWTYLTALIIGKDIDPDVPDRSEYFSIYGPTFELQIEKGQRRDCNDEKYLSNVVGAIGDYCGFISKHMSSKFPRIVNSKLTKPP
ncbi:histone deacetylase 8-like [Cylas formicarius]|uniref:histone deacetylase 8-like n=1 Tax=Cylas formicarius TaxID=197179 RepID=UPI00295853AD|nr:histone deacetylase 8-like [Cylas formicarius]